MPEELVNVRYMVDDGEDAVAFYTEHFGFAVRTSVPPAFVNVQTMYATSPTSQLKATMIPILPRRQPRLSTHRYY